MLKIIVEDNLERLDKFLAVKTEYSRSTIEKMLDEKLILVNNKIEKASYKVKENDEIELPDDYIKEMSVSAVKMDLKIVYEDESIIIVDKPSGLVVHPGSGNINNTLVNGLLYYTNSLSNVSSLERPGIVHRIDKDTTGLLIVAKNNKAHEQLAKMFKEHTIKREYIALLNGVFPHDSATIDAPIGRDPKDRKKMTVTQDNSKKAITNLQVMQRYTNNTLVKLKLETGRTHQIRVHMKYIGYPVHNDPVYTTNKATSFGQFLHSYSMEFNHPITNELLKFTSPLPAEFQNYVDSLTKI